MPLSARLPHTIRAIRFDPLGILGLCACVGLWYAVSELRLVSQVFLPSPAVVARAAIDNLTSSPYLAQYYLGNGGLLAAVEYTTSNVLIALLISSLLGITLGLLSARVDTIRALVDPLLLTVGTIPILVTAPFFLIWFGTQRAAQVLLLVIFETAILYLVAQRALENLSPTYTSNAQTLGAGRGRLLRDVYLPGTLPEILGGVRIALAGAWGLEAVSELLGAPNGIGRVVHALAGAADIPTLMAAVAVLAIVAVGFDLAVALLFAVLTRWRRESRA
jgi:ABC-type nitrate/sulfonate/bicarbonate transport system permease component